MKNPRYKNPHIHDVKKSLWDILVWQLGGYRDPMPPPKAPDGFNYPNPVETLKENQPKITWINHCTFLIQIDGVNILTDPIWSNRCSPIPFVGPKRHHEPAIAIDDLPEIDVVLVSHDHYDHLDANAVDHLHRNFPWIQWQVPSGLKSWFTRRGIDRVNEQGWWQESVHRRPWGGPEMQFTAVPTQHFSGRNGWHANTSLWAGWVVDFRRPNRDNKRLYFVGDTGYNPYDFKKIGDRFGKMDLSLIPIGTYVPHAFMSPVHIDPTCAVKIHQEVNSSLSVGMHWKTFCLSSEGMTQPPYDLYLSLDEANLNPLCFRVVDPGQTINW